MAVGSILSSTAIRGADMGATVRIENVKLEGLRKYLAEFGDSAVQGLEVGIFEDATNEQTGMRIAQYAAYNEFGTTTIPSRPFLGQTFREQSKKYADIIMGGIKANIADPERALRVAFLACGRTAQADVVDMIKSDMPPNDSEYQMRKKEKKGAEYTTLIDTASMVKSIGFRLTNKSGGHIA